MSARSSSGIVAMGHGGAGERSVGGGSPWIERVEKSSIRDCRVGGRPCREWWAVLGTVTEALDGFGSEGFGLGAGNDDAGKCLFLYAVWTLGSSCGSISLRVYFHRD